MPLVIPVNPAYALPLPYDPSLHSGHGAKLPECRLPGDKPRSASHPSRSLRSHRSAPSTSRQLRTPDDHPEADARRSMLSPHGSGHLLFPGNARPEPTPATAQTPGRPRRLAEPRCHFDVPPCLRSHGVAVARAWLAPPRSARSAGQPVAISPRSWIAAATAERSGRLARPAALRAPLNLPACNPPGCSSGLPGRRSALGSYASD